jgi:hypothetical protein
MGVSSIRQPYPMQARCLPRIVFSIFCSVLPSLALNILGITSLSGLASGVQGAEPITASQIGLFTEVQGQVRVTHPGMSRPIPVKLYDAVRFKDVIETQRGSQAKALFYDDSLLTVGEHSRVEITEHIFDPARNKRCLVVNLLWGTVRVLVGKVFTGSGSKFEIHTPSAVAAARGTYFVVWADQRSSGVVNIGDHGRVDFTAEGLTVGLAPHQFSFSRARRLPTRPTAVSSGAPTGVWKAVKETDVKDHLKPQSTLATAPVTVWRSSAAVSPVLWSPQHGQRERRSGGPGVPSSTRRMANPSVRQPLE